MSVTVSLPAIMENPEHNNTTVAPSLFSFAGLSRMLEERPTATWLICATISLLSSKYLLVELNVHYPLYLHLLHLVTATLLTIISRLRQRSKRPHTLADRPSISGWILLVVLAGMMVLAMACTMQAILHFQNLPTVVILSVGIPSMLLLYSHHTHVLDRVFSCG